MLYLCFDTSRLWDQYCIIRVSADTPEHWYLLSSQPTTLQTFAQYGLRFDIEEKFSDDKSNGFELERSLIRTAIALSRLYFVLAVATLFLTLQGTAVVAVGKRR